MFRKDAQPASKLWVSGSNPDGITKGANATVATVAFDVQ